MKRTELAEKIISELNEITLDSKRETVDSVFKRVVRSLNLVGEKDQTLFKKFAVDLMQLYESEKAFQKLRKMPRTSLSEGFIKSFQILKDEITKALENLIK